MEVLVFKKGRNRLLLTQPIFCKIIIINIFVFIFVCVCAQKSKRCVMAVQSLHQWKAQECVFVPT